MVLTLARSSPDLKVPQPGESPTPIVPETPMTPMEPDPVPATDPIPPTIPEPDPDRQVPIEPPAPPQVTSSAGRSLRRP
jgi:hypothetical protein